MMLGMRAGAIVSTLFLVACANEGALSPENTPENANGIEVVTAIESQLVASPHLMLGTPVDSDPSDDYLMTKNGYALSYNNVKHVPNWTAWRLRSSDLGSLTRRDAFAADRTLPSGFYAVVSKDYKGSGYTRGHMCPSADRTTTSAANAETFLFTNMVPQTSALNSGPWEKLESYERGLALSGSDVYIIAGSLFSGSLKTIGNDVAVPSHNYKIVVSLPSGARLNDVTTSSTVIAVNMPNTTSVPSKTWESYEVSMGDIERLSGYRFLTGLTDGVHDALAGVTPVARVAEAAAE